MTTMERTVVVDDIDAGLVRSAAQGDADAFRRLILPFQPALHLHCYRMLGSLHDADDLLQETLLRAWTRMRTFSGRGSFRAWLYQIATNACLDALRRRSRRTLPDARFAPSDPRDPVAPDVTDVPWLEPYPDALLGADGDPEARYLTKESVALAFIAALQFLPPRQRTALILRDVLGWDVPAVAGLLRTSVASVNSALQRARAKVEAMPQAPPPRVDPQILDRYLRAWETGNAEMLASLLQEDVILTMPPSPSWYRGRADVAAFFARVAFHELRGRLRLRPISANGQGGFTIYRWEPATNVHEAMAIKVFTLGRDRIARITGFVDPGLFKPFGLPARLNPALQPL